MTSSSPICFCQSVCIELFYKCDKFQVITICCSEIKGRGHFVPPPRAYKRLKSPGLIGLRHVVHKSVHFLFSIVEGTATLNMITLTFPKILILAYTAPKCFLFKMAATGAISTTYDLQIMFRFVFYYKLKHSESVQHNKTTK